MKLKIDNEILAEEFFEQTCLIGIVAPIKDYHFCWQLNQLLGFDFRINPNIEIQLTKKNRQYFFSVYKYVPPSSSLRYYLYNNQYQGEYLLPEFKHLDFLWLVKGDVMHANDLQDLLQSIKTVTSVQLVNELTADKIKHKQHLIF